MSTGKIKQIRKKDTEFIDPGKIKVPQPQRIAVSKKGMVSTAHYEATKAGVEILNNGGNAIDAAVASALALGVCEPQASGLGGQTMMLIHLAEDNRTFALDGSSRVPNRVLVEEFSSPKKRKLGYEATTVPSTLATLEYAQKRYGTFTLADLLLPAIKLADNGYQITRLQHELQKRELKELLAGNASSLFLKNNKPYSPGSIFKQPVLAGTLQRIADKGVEDFYQGEIADLIHNDMQHNKGFVNKDDLANIPWPIERETIRTRFSNMYVNTMPPPGSGRTLIEMLNVIKRFPKENRNPDTPLGSLIVAETIRRAQLNRRDRPFDPNFYPQVIDSKMLSQEHAKMVAKQIKERIKTSGETTHLSVMDKSGNVVALTQSIERVYGAKVATPDLGFLYNNYMCAFDHSDIAHPYYLRPNGVPWASVAPTIIFKSGKPWLAIGSPGSERIASAIMQIIIRLQQQSPFDAVAAPRIHCSVNSRVSLEAAYMRDDIPVILKKHGFTIDVREPMSFYMGCIQMVLADNGNLIGVADPRRDGSAGGC